jgi:hypothetical protein
VLKGSRGHLKGFAGPVHRGPGRDWVIHWTIHAIAFAMGLWLSRWHASDQAADYDDKIIGRENSPALPHCE